MRNRRLAIWLLSPVAALVAVGAAFAALPGAHRMAAPTLFGFRAVATDVYAPRAMNPGRARAIVATIEEARRSVAAFYGHAVPMPRFVLCPEKSCDDAFGASRAAGFSLASIVVRLNDNGFNRHVVIYELARIQLMHEVGLGQALSGEVPAWFGEGLALLIAGGDPSGTTASRDAIERVVASGPWWRWNATVRALGAREAYAAASAAVGALKDEIGERGLAAIAARVGAGETFDHALAAERTRAAKAKGAISAALPRDRSTLSST